MSDLTTRLFDDADTTPLDPFDVFADWFGSAVQSEINDPNAMTVASIGADGLPDLRIILLKEWDAQGFVFFTNYESAKGRQLLANPGVALLFHWKSLRRQVRVRGTAGPVEPLEADAYFATRPRDSQIGAHASDQSRPLASRAELLERVAELKASFGDGPVPRPAYWSGFRVIPETIEFWQNGEFRLHDRVLFTREGDGWTRQRLNP